MTRYSVYYYCSLFTSPSSLSSKSLFFHILASSSADELLDSAHEPETACSSQDNVLEVTIM